MVRPSQQFETETPGVEISCQTENSESKAYSEKTIHILHVDDDICILEVSKSVLEMEGNFKVDPALSVAEAMEKLSGQKYDAIISDYEMPQKNGLEFLRELRGKDNEIPFIILTGRGREEVAIQALNLGADYYVSKSGSPETVYGELAHHVTFAVERRRAIAQNKNAAAVLENLSDAIVTTDDTFKITSWNKTAEEMFGWNSSEANGRGFREIFENVPVSPTFSEITRTVLSESRFFGEIVYRNRTGQLGSASLSGIALRDKTGKLVSTVTVCHDITQRKRAEEERASSENYLKTIFESVPTGIIVINEQTHEIVDINPYALETIGASKEQIVGRICHKFVCPTDKGKCPISDLRQAVDRSERRLLASGREIPILKTVVEMTWKGQKYLVESFVNISDRKKAEDALEKSREEYRQLVDNLQEGLWVIDKDARTTFVNPRMAEMLGYSQSEMIGKHLFSFMDPDSCDDTLRVLKRRAAGELNQFAYEFEFKDKSGKKVYTNIQTKGIVDEIGQFKGSIGTITDVTKRKELEEALKESETRFRIALKIAPVEVGNLDLNLRYTWVYNSFTKKQPEEIVSRDFGSVIAFEDFEGLRKLLVQMCTDGVPVHREMFGNFEGEKFIIDFFFEPLKNKKGEIEGITYTAFDITQRKHIEEALRISEEKYRRLFENARDTIYTHDLKGKIASVNKAVEEYGLKPESIIGRNVLEFVPPEYWPKLEAQFIRLSQGNSVEGEIEVVTPIGNRKAEYRSNIISEGQKIVGAQTILRDITERAEAAKALAEERDKLNIIGSFTRHDVRNKLASINGNIYLAKRNSNGNQKLLENLKYVENDTRNIARILDFAATYEKLGSQQLTPIDVGVAFTDAASLFVDLREIEIINNCKGLVVLADSVLTTIFHNFIDNSLKYGEKETFIKLSWASNENGSLSIIYEDDGTGIDPETRKKIFTAGFGKGTGYGLYLIKKTCEIYGWTVKETGETGKGARFEMNIPRAATQNLQSGPANSDSS